MICCHMTKTIISKINKSVDEVTVAIIYKYTSNDAYLSLIEALNHAAIHNCTKLNIKWVNARRLKEEGLEQTFNDVDAILVPGGFGDNGIEGKIMAVKYARENNIPYFGICLGMQVAVIEFARNVCNLSDALSTEFGATSNPVIALMTEWCQKDEVTHPAV